MNLEQFAKESGVVIIECDRQWGGCIGYKEENYPNVSICGFKTKEKAYKHWLFCTFGEHTSKTITKLLKRTERINK